MQQAPSLYPAWIANLTQISTTQFLCTSKPDINIKEMHPHCVYNITRFLKSKKEQLELLQIQ